MSQQNKVQGYLWRTEPEISLARQKELKLCLATVPDIKQGIYPFKGKKLSRADVEWLLATHENGEGPINWDDKSQRDRPGIDLRGADLKDLDLSGLPLTCMCGGITKEETAGITTNREQYKKMSEASAVHLENSDLHEAHLEDARLQYAYLSEAHLEGARLQHAHLKGADLETAHLEGAKLYSADLEEANLRYAYFDRTTNLDSISLNKAKLADVRWGDVNLALVAWERVEILGNESEAKNQKIPRGKMSKDEKKDKRNKWIRAYRRAIRANRQVATILRTQGWNEVADKLEYRARIFQRKLLYQQGLWRQRGLNAPKPNHWQRIRMIVSSRSSWFLDWVAGYGYKPWRWVRLYGLTNIVFAIFYYREKMPNATLLSALSIFTQQNFFAWLDAITTSVENLHSHSFTQGGISAIEAFVGLFVEAILIAIITGRILGKSGGGD